MTKAVIPPCSAPGTTSARFSTIRKHTVDLAGLDKDDTINYTMPCVFQKLAQCASLFGHEGDTQRILSLTLLAPDA